MKIKSYRQKITKQSEILLFGKFKHKTIQHVLRTEPSYILWLHDEKIVKFPREIILLAEDMTDDDKSPYGRMDWGLDFGRDD